MVGDAPKNIDIDKVISDELNGVVIILYGWKP
jgi:hypothetical protein